MMSSPTNIDLTAGDQLALFPAPTDAPASAYIFYANPYLGYPGTVTFRDMRAQILSSLLRAPIINRRSWQTLDVSSSSAHDTHELRNTTLIICLPKSEDALRREYDPDLPWADLHFQERVGGEPLNPAPSYLIWPHHNGSAERHVTGLQFSHTYPERFWPKRAHSKSMALVPGRDPHVSMQGIRYQYGDLDDVVEQLVANLWTRQAVLPVWFPEDTGSLNVRVPCSLSYHFMADEDGTINMWYHMRACDFYRHFTNDLYLAGRLLQWVCDQVAIRRGDEEEGVLIQPGTMNVTISSLHLFAGDAGKARDAAQSN